MIMSKALCVDIWWAQAPFQAQSQAADATPLFQTQVTLARSCSGVKSETIAINPTGKVLTSELLILPQI